MNLGGAAGSAGTAPVIDGLPIVILGVTTVTALSRLGRERRTLVDEARREDLTNTTAASNELAMSPDMHASPSSATTAGT